MFNSDSLLDKPCNENLTNGTSRDVTSHPDLENKHLLLFIV